MRAAMTASAKTTYICDARQSEAGFTLVELLVALTLLSFLSLAIFSTMGFGIKVWERITGLSSKIDEVIAAQTFARRSLAEAYPLFLPGDPTTSRIDFEGRSNSLIFLTSAPAVIGQGRMRVVFSIQDELGGRTLQVRTMPELAAGDIASQPIQTLLTGIEAAQFSYFGQRRTDKVAAWHDDWAGEPILPQLVRVQLRFVRDDSRLWPDLIVAPRISVDVSCNYDALTKRCRGR